MDALKPTARLMEHSESNQRSSQITASSRPASALNWVLLCVALNAVGQILFKVARSAQPEAVVLAAFYRIETWLALVLSGLSAACWLWILSRVQLSVAYPALALTFPVVVALSAILFSEDVSPVRWAGVGDL